MAKKNNTSLIIIGIAAAAGIYFLAKNSVPNVQVESIDWLTKTAIVIVDGQRQSIPSNMGLSIPGGFSIEWRNNSLLLFKGDVIYQTLVD